MKKRVYLFLVLACLLLSFPIILNKAEAVNGTTLQVEPQLIQDIGIGETFMINVSVTDAVEMYSWQIKIFFGPELLSCIGANYPADHVFAGKPMVPVVPIIDNDEGYIIYGASLMGDLSFTGSGTLCQVEFEVLGTGSCGLNFSEPYGRDTFLLNYDLEKTPATTMNGYFANVPMPSHDIVVTDLSLSDDRPVQNETVTITVGVLNNGTVAETFDVSMFDSGNLIEIQTVASLGSGEEETLTFDWNTTGVPLGTHTIRAEAEVVPGEIKTSNNVRNVTAVVVSPTAVSTDINGDGIVNMEDIGEAARAYGADMEHPRWDPAIDINGDGIISLIDIALICRDFGTESV